MRGIDSALPFEFEERELGIGRTTEVYLAVRGGRYEEQYKNRKDWGEKIRGLSIT